MADFILTAAPVLGVDMSVGTNRIVERDDLALVSIAIPLDGEEQLAQVILDQWKLPMPTARQSASAGDRRLVQTGHDQLMMVFPHPTPDANKVVQGKLDGTGYTTDQTDSWVVLEVSGPDSRAALERICAIDLHPNAFGPNDAARTSMEHLGTLILRTDQDSFLMMSARSSAQTFLHAIETSFRAIL